MNLVSLLRILVLAEGISYLALWLVAMPLKYLFHLPLAVRVIGGLHGLLFTAFVLLLYQTHVELSWTKRRSLGIFLLSLVPGSFFWLDRRIREDA